ncbi:DUF2652 domain-containing protein [Ruegeria atlantica]|uniref:Polyketide cyclase / dehydrase and lipid transport n=1 Tax=Ruegeria atlantica TaxID=81569 RepID=A0A0P1ENS4_9RHOB|nr:DUF2652 domain-containing protein [Ruegeria atlantica]CUH43973.1 Polyketide cyclase / dehydrase and lipid transport [Ruegeria atlantica]
MTSTHTGYLLIADITGYTQFLTSSEMDHANPILQSLLGVLLEQIGDPLSFWKTEGDAVLAYSKRQDFPSGETFLTICENLYNAFTLRRQHIISNTTCPCQACANVNKLDLKIIAHHGRFDEMRLGSTKDISGPDVILVHRMTKTEVNEHTGIRSYALFSEAAAQAMNISEIMKPFSQDFDHFGEVRMKVYDLAKSWETLRANREREFLREEDGVWTMRYHFDAPIGVVWEALVAPEQKLKWMNSVSDIRMENPLGRLGPGSGYHCAHAMAEFFYRVTDWEPFEYFSTRILDPARPVVSFPETYHLTETGTGTELRYTMGIATDADGARSKISEKECSAFLADFWAVSFADMNEQLSGSR